MSTVLYSYSPRAREGLTVEVTGGAEDGCSIRVTGSVTSTATGTATTMSVPDARVPEVARGILAAMHEAAGLGVPIVLDQVPDRTFADWMEIRDRMVLLDVRGPLPFESARRFAATLVAAVERAERGPDPAEVETLAGVIRADEQAHGGRPDRWAERAARAVLDRYELKERTDG